MNWSAIAAIVSIIGLLATLLTAAFVYGKLTQKADATAQRVDEHDARLTDHGERIGQLEGWSNAIAVPRPFALRGHQ